MGNLKSGTVIPGTEYMRSIEVAAHPNRSHSTLLKDLVVEESKFREGHGHAVGVARRDDLGVCHGATRLRNELHAELGAVVDGVSEGEEGVG